jgi:hypothetical protein
VVGQHLAGEERAYALSSSYNSTRGMGDKSGGGSNMPLETGPTPIARAFYSFLTLMDQLDEIDEFHFGDLERALEQRVEQPRLETMQKMLMAYVRDR